MKKLLILPAALLLGTAAAAPKISAQSIIVNPAQPDLSVRVFVNKDTTGQAVPNYRVNENISITAVTNQDAYVYLFNVDAKGKITQILPNKLSSGGNFVKANTAKTFPAPGDNFTFTIDEPAGLNKVLALASKTELNLSQITEFQGTGADAQFATGKVEGQQQLAQALSIVVNPLPQNTWVSDTAFFNVLASQNTSTGALFVGSSAPGSVVYINGRQVGEANVTYTNLQPGSYQLRVVTAGYTDFNGTVAIRAGATVNVNVDPVLARPAQPAPVRSNQSTISLRSTVNGALVFVDGRQVGTVQNGGLNITVPNGAHEIVLIASGFRTFVNTYNVSQSGTITITPTR